MRAGRRYESMSRHAHAWCRKPFSANEGVSLTATSATNADGPTPIPPFSLDATVPAGRLLEQTAAAFEGMGMPLARRWAETLVAAVLDVPHRELDAYAGKTLRPEQQDRKSVV